MQYQLARRRAAWQPEPEQLMSNDPHNHLLDRLTGQSTDGPDTAAAVPQIEALRQVRGPRRALPPIGAVT